MADLIDRQAAIEAIYHHMPNISMHRARSIEPERKTGKWIKQNPLVDTEECSECGYNILSEELETPFCPWCGSPMMRKEGGQK